MPQQKDRTNLTKLNYILLVVSFLILTIGYIIMSMNDITISPILLSIVYVALIPLALLYHPQRH